MTHNTVLTEDTRNIRNIRAMKTVLAQKLFEEGTSFTINDLNIIRSSNGYTIWVNDYDHIKFKLTFDYDDYFGYGVWIYDPSEGDYITWVNDKNVHDVKTALIHLGYHIANTF